MPAALGAWLHAANAGSLQLRCFSKLNFAAKGSDLKFVNFCWTEDSALHGQH